MARASYLGVLLAMTLLPTAFAADDHVVVSPADLKWGPLPPTFPKGGESCRGDGRFFESRTVCHSKPSARRV